MSTNRPYVLTLAGFDPSAGAGVLADIKTFEQIGVYGLAINTAITLQTETVFKNIRWEDELLIENGLNLMLASYPVKVIKIGIIPSLNVLSKWVSDIKNRFPDITIVWDPVIRSSTQHNFFKLTNAQELKQVIECIDLITPNADEALALSEIYDGGLLGIVKQTNVLLKGGHNDLARGIDTLYWDKKMFKIHPFGQNIYPKHGSGCVLASAITAYLALGLDMLEACQKAKYYTEKVLESNTSLLGWHKII